MPIEKLSCSLHDDAETVVASTAIHIHGHPGITEWHGTLGPLEEPLEIDKAYRIKLDDGREGLIVIRQAMKAWGGASGQRYEFEGTGPLA